MQIYDHRSLIYEIIGTQERVLVRQGKRTIKVPVIKVLLYIPTWSISFIMGAPKLEVLAQILRALDKKEYLMIIFLISQRTHYVVTPHLNRLIETV